MDELGDAAIDEAAILEEYRDALRDVLRDVAPGIAGIRGQLESALPELRAEGEGSTLLLALRNLESLFTLLDQLARSVGAQPLLELDRFDAGVRRFLAELDGDLAAAPEPERIARRIEHELLPTLARWSEVQGELAAAVDAALPEPDAEGAAGERRVSGVPRLSVCMIVRDEAETLPHALASLAEPVDEIVIVDTGSRDATREIARRAGARLLETPWCDDFAAARNVSLAAARGAWCLVIDADECVEAASWPALAAFLAARPAALGRVTIASDTAEGVARESVVRVCRGGGGARFEGRIHEQLVGEGAPAETGLVLHHSGYAEAALVARNKLARNERLLRRALVERPDDLFLAWQLGRTLWKQGGAARSEALRRLGGVVDAVDATPWLAGALRDLGYALREVGRARDALQHVQRARRSHPRFTDLAFLEGLLQLDLGDAAAMGRAFRACLRLGEPRGYSSVEGVGSFRARANLGLFHELSGDVPGARRHYEAALADSADFAPAREGLARLAARPPGAPRRAAG